LRLVILLLFAAIVASLASAALALVRRREDPRAMVRALTVRISLSVLLFVLLMLGWAAGLIEPHGVVP
jgi:formate-dependent nitrite reductase membrane component NrfD